MPKRNSIRYLTAPQKKQLLKTLADSRKAWRDYFFCDLALNTGLRLAEALSLNIGDVHNGHAARESIEIRGKGDRIRSIPLNQSVRGHIDRYVARRKRIDKEFSLTNPLFLSRNNRRISHRGMQLSFNKWVAVSGLEGRFSPHCLRHSVAMELLRKTNNIRKIQAFLGHRYISTTQVYTHVSQEDLIECAALLAD